MQARYLRWLVEHKKTAPDKGQIGMLPAVPKGTNPEAAVQYGGLSFFWPCSFLDAVRA